MLAVITVLTSKIGSLPLSSTILPVAMWSLSWRPAMAEERRKKPAYTCTDESSQTKSKLFASRLNKSKYNRNINNSTISPSLDTQQSKLSWRQCNIKQNTINTVKQNLSTVCLCNRLNWRNCEDLEQNLSRNTLSLLLWPWRSDSSEAAQA